MKYKPAINLAFSAPALIAGWFLFLLFIYYIVVGTLNTSTAIHSPWLSATWSIVLSFGFVSLATVIASKVNFTFHEKAKVIFKYSLISITVAFVLFFTISVILGISTALWD